jgi:hypothetical protein
MVVALLFGLVCFRLGRRAERRADAVVLAPAVLALAFVLGHLAQFNQSAEPPGLLTVGSLATATLTWGALIAVHVMGVLRLRAAGRRWLARALAVLGVPVAVELATAAGALPATLRAGLDPATVFGWAPGILSGQVWSSLTNDNFMVLGTIGGYPRLLASCSVLAMAFALGAAGTRAARTVAPPAAQPAGRRSRAAAVAGLAGVVVGVVGWVYTVAVLTPAMPEVSEAAPMPGGDGELYLWVAELRWGAILLAALGALVALADRRAAPLAAAVVAGALLAVDAVIGRSASAPGVLGAPRDAAIAGVLAVMLAWWIAGPARGSGVAVVRRRLAVAALTAATTGPLLLTQGTHEVNHPYLPVGLLLVTGALPTTFGVLAAIAVTAARETPLGRGWAIALAVVPALVMGGTGLAVALGAPLVAMVALGPLAAGPLTLAVAAVLVPARRWLWAVAIPGLGVPLGAVLALGGVIGSTIAAELLFTLAGTSYPADGLSLVPGAALFAVPVSTALARRFVTAGPEIALPGSLSAQISS